MVFPPIVPSKPNKVDDVSTIKINKIEPKQKPLIALKSKPKQKAVQKTTPSKKPATSAVLSSGCSNLRKDLARLGVPANQLNSAIILAQRESGCSHSAVNSSSGACGVFQSLPCGKWGAPGTDQYLRGAIAYANGRYGGYNGALAHSHANGWY